MREEKEERIGLPNRMKDDVHEYTLSNYKV
jgi:hypothetical protein